MIGLSASPHGDLYALSADGDIYRRMRDPHYNGPPVTPMIWVVIPGPGAGPVTAVTLGTQGNLTVLAGGSLFERVRDRTYLQGEKWLWQEIEPPVRK